MKSAENPVISVVVLTYNQQESVSRTLDCILSQTTAWPYEIVIGEDGSRDGTRAVCERYAQQYAQQYPDRIQLMPEAPNKGVIANYRDCLAACKGKYIAVCAGDDWWQNPEKLQMQADYLETHPGCALVFTDYDIYRVKHDKIKKNVLQRKSFDATGIVDKILWGFFLPSPTIMYRRELLRHINFDEYIRLGYQAEDLPMYLTFALHGTLDCIPVSTTTYTSQAGSLSHFDDARKMERFMLNIRDIKLNFVRSHGGKTVVTAEQLDALYDRILFRQAFKLGDSGIARKYLARIPALSTSEKFKRTVMACPPLFRLFREIKKIR